MRNQNLGYSLFGFVSAIMLLVLFSSCKDKSEAMEQSNNQEVEAIKESNFVDLFDGKTLKGWSGDTTYWRVENGNLVGEVTPTTPLENNTFIVLDAEAPSNFELKLEFKISEAGNSGVNYRSEILENDPYRLKGYQADIDGKNKYTGQNYEEKKRATLAYRGEKVIVSAPSNMDKNESVRANVKNNCWQSRVVESSLGVSDTLKAKIKFEDWNALHLIVNGNRLQHYVNNVLMSEVIDNDTLNRKMSGKLGMQVHVGPPMKVEYRNIQLKGL